MRTIGRRRIVVTIAAGPVATPISATALYTTDFEIYFPAGNTDTVGYIGNSAVTTANIPRTRASTYNFVHGTGTIDGGSPVLGFNLANLYVLTSTAGDTCIVEYMAIDNI